MRGKQRLEKVMKQLNSQDGGHNSGTECREGTRRRTRHQSSQWITRNNRERQEGRCQQTVTHTHKHSDTHKHTYIHRYTHTDGYFTLYTLTWVLYWRRACSLIFTKVEESHALKLRALILLKVGNFCICQNFIIINSSLMTTGQAFFFSAAQTRKFLSILRPSEWT